MAVYQHFPSQAYGLQINAVAAELLRPGGLGLIQIRYNDLANSFPGHEDDYLNNYIEFTSYGLEAVRRHLGEVGLEVVDMDVHSATCYGYFMVRRLP